MGREGVWLGEGIGGVWPACLMFALACSLFETIGGLPCRGADGPFEERALLRFQAERFDSCAQGPQEVQVCVLLQGNFAIEAFSIAVRCMTERASFSQVEQGADLPQPIAYWHVAVHGEETAAVVACILSGPAPLEAIEPAPPAVRLLETEEFAVMLAPSGPAIASVIVDQDFEREPVNAVPERRRIVDDPDHPGSGCLSILDDDAVSPQNSGLWLRTAGYFFSERRFFRIRPDEAILRYKAKMSACPLNASTGVWIDDGDPVSPAVPGGPLFFGDCKIKYVGPDGSRNPIMDYSPGTWYDFKVRYRLRTQAYDITVRDLGGTVLASRTDLPFRNPVQSFQRIFVYMNSGSPDELRLRIDDLKVEAEYRIAVLGTGTEEETNLVSMLQRLCGEIGIDATVQHVDAASVTSVDDLLDYALVAEAEPELCYHGTCPIDLCVSDLLAGDTGVLLLEDGLRDLTTSCADCYAGTYSASTTGQIRIGDGSHPVVQCAGLAEGECYDVGAPIAGIVGPDPRVQVVAAVCDDPNLIAAGTQDRGAPGEGRLAFLGAFSATDYAWANTVFHEDPLRCTLAWLLEAVPVLRVAAFRDLLDLSAWVELDATQNVAGFSFGAQAAGCVSFVGPRPGPDNFAPDFWEAAVRGGGTGITVACLRYLGDPPVLKPIQPGAGLRIAELRFADPTPMNSSCEICFTGNLGDPPVRIRVSPVGGEASLGAVTRCGVSVAPPIEVPRFRRGDANCNNVEIDIADPVYMLHCLYFDGPCRCLDAMDFEDDGQVTLGDVVYLLNWLFRGGPEPAPSGPNACGPDPTADDLTCLSCDFCGTGPTCVPASADVTVLARENNIPCAEGGVPVDTGIDIQGIARVRISASGAWGGAGDTVDCNGDPTCIPRWPDPNGPLSECPEIRFPLSALVGKVGDGPWFVVGCDFDEIVTDSGRLYLAHFDADLLDNHGIVDAHIEAVAGGKEACQWMGERLSASQHRSLPSCRRYRATPRICGSTPSRTWSSWKANPPSSGRSI